MVSTLWQFRDLFFALEEHDGPAEDLFVPWLDQHPEVIAELHGVGRPEAARTRVAPDPHNDTVLEGLYALSRVVDLLLLPHQPAPHAPARSTAWQHFRTAVGAVLVAENSFHPFFHEIVSVQGSDDPNEPPSLVGEYWPGAIVGSLLLARSGVAIRAGASHVDPQVAAHSCLYWAWARRNRPTMDLSVGWGRGSQWRTDFRRDYVTDGTLFYNVDAGALDHFESELDERDRLDLLRHRCSIQEDLGDDAFPYHLKLVEPAP